MLLSQNRVCKSKEQPEKKAFARQKKAFGIKLSTNTKDTRCLWQGFHVATGYKPTAKTMNNDPCFPDDLN